MNTQPDWSDSETSPAALWKNPLRPLQENLEIADGAIAFRDKTIANLRQQLAELRGQSADISSLLSLPG